jgi:4,5-dihydroxyphthalate decarboxylase
MEETLEVLGADFWPYGVEKNNRVLEFTLKEMKEQGLIDESMNLKQLFPLSLQE